MSLETPTTAAPQPAVGEDSFGDLDLERHLGPKPRAHGAAVCNHFADADTDEPSLYERAYAFYRERVGGRENEDAVVASGFEFEWLPELASHEEYVMLLSSSRWKAGQGIGDAYSAWYQYHLKLRIMDEEGETRKPATACHVEVMPQDGDLVYKDGAALELPYGEGTRVVCSTTWAESGEEIEARMLDVLAEVYGADQDDLRRDRVHDSRRIQKAEAHVRFLIGKKALVIETLRQSQSLIDYGGNSEIQAAQDRQREGYLEAYLKSDRWDLLGFSPTPYDIAMKVYHATEWYKRGEDDPFRHPKLEASFAGVDSGALPHVEAWDHVLETLREVVSAHLEWADVGREHLVADDYFDGPHAPEYDYSMPVGRREQLRERYEEVATDIYRQALNPQTTAVYDILRIMVEEYGATYDVLEARTGLARSTIRYHARNLEEAGIAKRIGNPVVLVFESDAVLDEARDITDKVNPGDTADDMRERAEERRERREDDEEENPADDTSTETAAEWRALAALSASMDDVWYEHLNGTLGDEDVRVRRDQLPERLR